MSWSIYAAVYDRLWANPLHLGAIERAAAHLDPQLPVDEVGAGTGLATRVLRSAGFEVVSSEPNAAMRARFRQALPGVEVLPHPLEGPPVVTRPANVLAVNVLHLVEDPHAALRTLRARAGPDGRVVVVTPVLGTSLGDLALALRRGGVTASVRAKTLALHVATAPIQAACRARPKTIDAEAVADAIAMEDIEGLYRLVVLRGA